MSYILLSDRGKPNISSGRGKLKNPSFDKDEKNIEPRAPQTTLVERIMKSNLLY